MAEARLERGRYTDDIEMMIALTESLIKKKKSRKGVSDKMFSKKIHSWRDYGLGTRSVLGFIRGDIDINEAVLSVFSGGFFGNGSVMRVAPLGLFYSRGKNSLKQAAYEQSKTTYSHPLTCEEAYLQAYAISRLMEYRQSNYELELLEFLNMFLEAVFGGMNVFYQIFSRMRKYLTTRIVEKKKVIEVLGNDITAVRFWPAALYSFLFYRGNFKQAVVYAVNLGGGSDTIGAMAGALAKAFYGASAIPRRWLEVFENGGKGREYISFFAQRVFHLSRNNEDSKE
jgi:ADP-ribosylglycohydrolase